MNKVMSGILFNRALIWIVLMHLADNELLSYGFAFVAVLNLFNSFSAWREG